MSDDRVAGFLFIQSLMIVFFLYKDFLEVAYNAKSRQEIVRGITTYTNRSIAVRTIDQYLTFSKSSSKMSVFSKRLFLGKKFKFSYRYNFQYHHLSYRGLNTVVEATGFRIK
jgi:hypothetical protein